MKRIVLAMSLVFGFTVFALADLNLNVETYMDYKVTFTTNTASASYNDFDNVYLYWAGVFLYGDITKDLKANFLFDLSGNSPFATGPYTAGLWYANMAWTVLPASVLTVGLQDSLFGLMVPSDNYGRNVDLGLTWSQTFADMFSYSLQVLKGNIATMDTWFDADTIYNAINISALPRKIPTVQLMLTLTPLKGLTIGGAGRFSTMDYYDGGTLTTNTNTELGAEGFLTVTSDLVPGLGATLDFVTLMNTVKYDTNLTNANSFYFAMDVNYAIGPVTPGLRYVMRDANTMSDSTNDMDQWIDIYAKIDLSGDGLMKLIPYFSYNLMTANSSTPEDTMWFRLRFDYQFDFPIFKSEEAKEETK